MNMSATMKSTSPIDLYRDPPLVKGHRLKLTTSTPFIPEYVQSSLTQSSDPVGIYSSRVKSRQIILENPVRESKAKKERDGKRARRAAEREKRKVSIMGRREASDKGIWKLDKEQAKFDLFIPLHRLWVGYMSELLALPAPPPSAVSPGLQALPGAAGMHAKLVKADFHGSIITVRQSKNPCLVGLSGIVIHETENTFKVVTRKDQLKCLPKQNSVFAFAVPLYSTLQPSSSLSAAPVLDDSPFVDKLTTILDGPHIEFELYGNQFRFRSGERAGRKFKPKETIEL